MNPRMPLPEAVVAFWLKAVAWLAAVGLTVYLLGRA